jgi:hypothetical protein
MSHHTHAATVCPNCGHPAENNYCSQCGQPTHLHNDTFLGLVTHFVAHYFHYDSKFWKTLKTLWTKPGTLTIAYREKKRMRFIDPISLYIFVSAVFFLCFFIRTEKLYERNKNDIFKVTSSAFIDTIAKKSVTKARTGFYTSTGNESNFSATTDSSFYKELQKESKNPWRRALANIIFKPEYPKAFFDMLVHSFPKAVFFMIPVMALMLQLLFIRRQETGFVDHGIFALHFHSFWFSIMLFRIIYPVAFLKQLLGTILMLVGVIYFVIALHKVYGVSYRRSIAYSVVIGSVYSFVLTAVLMGIAFIVFYQQGV